MKEIQTDKFCESVISVRSFIPFERKTITALNLLLAMLNRTTEAFDTRQKVSNATAHAYGTRIGYGNLVYGEQVKIELRMCFLREALIDDPAYTGELIELFDQFAFHPLFCEEALEEARYLHGQLLTEIAQTPDALAQIQAMSAIESDEAFSIYPMGYLDDLDAITLDDILALRKAILEQPVEIYVCGALSSRLHKAVEERFVCAPVHTAWSPCPPQDCVEVSSEKNIAQSAMYQVYTTGINPEDPQYFALTVLNALLGASSISLLFETVREQHSLCYAIGTALTRFGGLLYIHMDTDRANLEQARRLIDQVLDDVRNKRVDEKTFEVVKNEIIDNLRGQNDSPMMQIEQAFLNDILNRPLSLEQIVEHIASVTIDDVSAVASAMQPAVVSLVLQAQNGENDLLESGEEATGFNVLEDIDEAMLSARMKGADHAA